MPGDGRLVNVSDTRYQVNEQSDHATRIIVLVCMLLISLLLLIWGTHFPTTSLTLIIFVVTFLFVYGIIDGAVYNQQWVSDFTMCVLPLVLAVLAGLLLAMAGVCFLHKVLWLSHFILGAALGGMGMYFIRAAVVSSNPALADNPEFAWYWVGLILISVISGVVAAYMKKLALAMVVVTIGSYGFAVSIAGFVTTGGADPIGIGWFIALVLAAAGISILLQSYWMTKRGASPTNEGEEEGGDMSQGLVSE